MSATATRWAGSTVIPRLRYRDAHGAIDGLCATFGFEKQADHSAGDGSVAHAQLILGTGMIMVGSVRNASQWGPWIEQPDEIDGFETQSAYIVVADADVIYQRAKSAGAEILLEIKDDDYGGRGFSCRDCESHMWSFGTYDPWRTP